MKREDRPQHKRLTVISGIPAGNSGTGCFVAHLVQRLEELTPGQTRLVARPERPALWQLKLWLWEKRYLHSTKEVLRYAVLLAYFHVGLVLTRLQPGGQLLLLHPQNLGFDLTLSMLSKRRQPALLYLLDSSFFCIASYNHVKSDRSACTDCISNGFEAIKTRNCTPFPRNPLPKALKYVRTLQSLVTHGRVKIAAQSKRQAALAQSHFRLSTPPPVVGLWTQDWDTIFEASSITAVEPGSLLEWDVVYHGHCLDAKGARWTAELARHCPQLRFLLAFAQPVGFEAPVNCYFQNCSWETGLQDAMTRARLTLVPSLWSAPIEGALIKSVVTARAVGVVDNPTSYCSELPDGLVLRLPSDPQKAANVLKDALDRRWAPSFTLKQAWIEEFSGLRNSFVPSLLRLADAESIPL